MAEENINLGDRVWIFADNRPIEVTVCKWPGGGEPNTKDMKWHGLFLGRDKLNATVSFQYHFPTLDALLEDLRSRAIFLPKE